MVEGPMSEPRAGSLRYKGSDGQWIVASPHASLYSTATMVATEYWDPKTQEWWPILPPDEDDEGATL